MIKSHWLELPISRTNFHGPKDVRGIEVWLYFKGIFTVIFLFLNIATYTFYNLKEIETQTESAQNIVIKDWKKI